MRSSGHVGGGSERPCSQENDSRQSDGGRSGRLSIVGIGPGDSAYTAPIVTQALADAQTIVGYTTYLDLLPRDLLAEKTIHSSGMTKERGRAAFAVASAAAGERVAVVSGGDAGVYGMAGLVLEMVEKLGFADSLDVETLPGIPALTAAAAVLGAPLGHDFAVISLSDLLTPLSVIENRLAAAAAADFVITLYNPRSKRRSDHLGRALEIISKERAPETPVGLVRNAGREGCSSRIDTLETFDPTVADMLSIIFIGNSATRLANDRMITPRGFFEKYGEPR